MGDISSDIPREVKDVLTKLAYLSKLPTGSKYNITDKSYVPSDSWLGAAKRIYYGESKTAAIDFINKAIDEAISVGRRYNHWKSTLQAHVVALSNALTNAEHTYGVKYPNISAEIDVIRLRIDPSAFIVACNQDYQTNHNPLTDPTYYQKSTVEVPIKSQILPLNSSSVPEYLTQSPKPQISLPSSVPSILSVPLTSISSVPLTSISSVPPPPSMPLPILIHEEPKTQYGSSDPTETETVNYQYSQFQKQSRSNSQEE